MEARRRKIIRRSKKGSGQMDEQIRSVAEKVDGVPESASPLWLA
jgi:hypothetical protein